MRFSELSPQTLEKLHAYKYDRILEKHEGPFGWEAKLRYDDLELLQADSYSLLLPIGREQHPNITILRCIVSRDEQVITLFLKDTTFTDDPEWEKFSAGRVAVCEKVPGEEFYLATVYHEWFITENP
jgi:hypothetical protein